MFPFCKVAGDGEEMSKGLSPVLGSVLTAQSLLGILSLPLCLCLSLPLSLCPSPLVLAYFFLLPPTLSQNKYFKKPLQFLLGILHFNFFPCWYIQKKYFCNVFSLSVFCRRKSRSFKTGYIATLPIKPKFILLF